MLRVRESGDVSTKGSGNFDSGGGIQNIFDVY